MAEQIQNIIGEFQHNLDAKGRLFIPSRLREELGDVFYVTIGLDRCLSVYPVSAWEGFTERFTALPYARARRMRPIFANAARLEPDAQGRVLIPQKLRDYADLVKDVVIIGVSDHAEIWSAEGWRAVEAVELLPENLAGIMEELGI